MESYTAADNSHVAQMSLDTVVAGSAPFFERGGEYTAMYAR